MARKDTVGGGGEKRETEIGWGRRLGRGNWKK